MAHKKRSKSASKKAKAEAAKKPSSRPQPPPPPPVPRASATVVDAVRTPRPSRRSSSLQPFSHQVTPRQSVSYAVGGVASPAALAEAERLRADGVYKEPPEWFDGADYEINDEGEIIGVAARRFAESVERDESSDMFDTDITERPSLLAQRRLAAADARDAASSSPIPTGVARGHKRTRAPSPTSLSPPPRLQDPFAYVNDARDGANTSARLPPPPFLTSRASGDHSQRRRSGALAPEAPPLFFHHFDAMTAIRVRLGVVPLPPAPGTHNKAGRTSEDAAAGDAPSSPTQTPSPSRHVQPRVSFVERFLNPQKFFQLPAASPYEAPVDILGWSGVYSALPVWLPVTSPAQQAQRATYARRDASLAHKRTGVEEVIGNEASTVSRSSSWWGRWIGKDVPASATDNDVGSRTVTTVETAASVTVVLSP